MRKKWVVQKVVRTKQRSEMITTDRVQLEPLQSGSRSMDTLHQFKIEE